MKQGRNIRFRKDVFKKEAKYRDRPFTESDQPRGREAYAKVGPSSRPGLYIVTIPRANEFMPIPRTPLQDYQPTRGPGARSACLIPAAGSSTFARVGRGLESKTEELGASKVSHKYKIRCEHCIIQFLYDPCVAPPTHTEAEGDVKLLSRAACSVFRIDALGDSPHQSPSALSFR